MGNMSATQLCCNAAACVASVCKRTHAQTHMYTHTTTHPSVVAATYDHALIHLYKQTHIHIGTDLHSYTHISAFKNCPVWDTVPSYSKMITTHTHTYTHTHTHIHTHACTHTHTHTHTHAHTHKIRISINTQLLAVTISNCHFLAANGARRYNKSEVIPCWAHTAVRFGLDGVLRAPVCESGRLEPGSGDH